MNSVSRRRLLTRLLTPLPAAALAGAARLGLAAPVPRRELVFWTMQLAPFHNDYVHGLIARFEASQPGVRVKWVDVPWAEAERKVLASLAAGTAPDVVNLNPQFSSRLAELGALADPRRYLSGAEQAAYLPSAWAANQLAGMPFALPWYLSTTVTLYRRDLLERAGTAPPASFEALRQAAQALRERAGTYAWFPAMDGSAPLENLVSMAGPLLTSDGCRPGFDSPAGVAAFEFHRELYQRQWIPRSVLTEGHRAAVAQFLSGQVAMVATGMQFIAHLRRNNPGLYAQVGVAPQVSSPRAPPNIAAMNLAVPTASAQPALAFAFAQFVTNADNQLALVRRVPLLPSTRASYDDALFQQASGDALLDQARTISVRQVFEGAVLVPPLRHYNKLRSSFVRQLQSAMVGRSSAQGAVQEVCRLWAPLLGCRA
jgi:putative chitobiose transport system substrate-binding protein